TEAKIIKDSMTKEIFDLTDEWGVWTWDGKIYIWNGINRKERIKVAIHEVVEYILVVKFKIRRLYAHRIANFTEKIIL
ncbi:MAG: hypothetical protein NZ845_05420, partial [Thermodesulfovibrio sp.]|nr:hypothetical protein [Thermodesulfovibrio sp.]